MNQIVIPKIIHFVWFPPSKSDQEIPKDVAKNIARWRHLYPDFEVKIWGYEDVFKKFLESQPEIAEAIEVSRFEAMRSDIARLAIIASEGGFYSDLKNMPNNRFLESLKSSEKAIILEHPKTVKNIPSGHLCNMFLGARPGSLFVKRLLQVVLDNVLSRVKKGSVVDITGANVWSKVAFSPLDNSEVLIVPSDVVWKENGAKEYWMSRTSASYNGADMSKHWSKKQKEESFYLDQ